MTMIGKAFAIVLGGISLLAPASAEDAPPGNDEGRYPFNKVEDGFVRLDTQTGDVSLCSRRAVGWACQAAPDDRAVLENEIARLRTENAALKRDILDHGLPLPNGAAQEPPAVRDGDRPPQLGDNSDLDRMMAFAGRLWHRFVDAIARAQKQVLNNKS